MSKVTIKSTICAGILAGWTADRILKQVAKKHPDSKADLTHIKYYSGHMKRDGEITEDQHKKYLSKPRKADSAPAKKASKAKVEKKPSAKKVEKKPAVKAKTKPTAKKVEKKPAAKKVEVKVAKKVAKKVPQKVKKQVAA